MFVTGILSIKSGNSARCLVPTFKCPTPRVVPTFARIRPHQLWFYAATATLSTSLNMKMPHFMNKLVIDSISYKFSCQIKLLALLIPDTFLMWRVGELLGFRI